MKRITWIFVVLFLSGQLLAQEKETASPKMKLVLIEPIWIEAEVIALLQGTDDLAVLQIQKVEENKWDLAEGDEFLAKFQFTTGPFKADEHLPGVKAGDVINAELYSRLNDNTVQLDHTILRYKVIGSTATAKP